MTAMTAAEFRQTCARWGIEVQPWQAAYAVTALRDDWQDRLFPRGELQAAVDIAKRRFAPLSPTLEAIADEYRNLVTAFERHWPTSQTVTATVAELPVEPDRAQRALPRPSTTPPMWSVNPTKSRRR